MFQFWPRASLVRDGARLHPKAEAASGAAVLLSQRVRAAMWAGFRAVGAAVPFPGPTCPSGGGGGAGPHSWTPSISVSLCVLLSFPGCLVLATLGQTLGTFCSAPPSLSRGSRLALLHESRGAERLGPAARSREAWQGGQLLPRSSTNFPGPANLNSLAFHGSHLSCCVS